MDIQDLSDIKNKLQAVIFSIEDGILMLDFKGNISLINDAARRYLDIEQGYPYSKKFLDYVQDGQLRQQLQQLIDSKEECAKIDLLLQKNKPLYLKVKKTLVTTAKAQSLGWVISFRDITLEKELEKSKEDFLHAIAHDLKNPLTPIQGFSQMLLEGNLGSVTKDQKYFLQIIVLSAKKLLRMIGNILDSAKLDLHKEIELNKSCWNLSDLVLDIVEMMKGSAQYNGVRLFCSINNKEISNRLTAVQVFADKEMIERVIFNLLDNALKFTGSGGEVEISLVQESQGQVCCSVRDTGKGIAPEFIDKIFERFHQVPGTKGGSGLGLSIVKYIVQKHDSNIQVQSELGKGTKFSFFLPSK